MARHLTMRKGFAGAAALLLLAAGTYLGQPGARGLQPSAVITPDGKEARSTALIITGAEGWTRELADRAQRLSDMHTLVVGVDGRALLAQAGGDCAAAAPLLSGLARRTQQQQGALARTPVLSGYGAGAAIAFHAAAAAPSSFKGLVTVHFDASPVPCAGNALKDAQAGKAPVRWLDIAQPGTVSAASGIAGAAVVAPEPDPRRAFYQSYLRLAGTDHAFDTQTAAAGSGLDSLPLTIHQQADAPASDTYAIFLSGDGGWANFDEQVSDRLAARGIPVAGISSLRYMWQEKRPEQIAADLVRIDSHFRRVFRRDKVLLLGFSLGASTLPFAAAEVPEDFRARLAGVGLIAPETHTGFEIVVGGWLGRQTGSVAVAPAIDVLAASLPPKRILCLYGRKETVSACPAVQQPGAQRLEFDGGHHLGKDYSRIADALATLVSSGP
ncbi:AcvB/VirJ family lysyl-phosphatidylglycerol hydrolase [Leisingera sp. F5]|uniref:AcvB/VirJ family lysyl-phosphatidylglycerol hydrolase n=1 Tax=Leisingera sp. F5 TaxID=1813816 RepID=UPI000A874541|nr:AcvB/VirJ family lysyl-phosphatidylglycerol hydrolase [Leisingera sp. F5]